MDSYLGSENPRTRFWGLGRVMEGQVREKNGTVPCRKPINLDVEELKLNTNSNVLNRATNLLLGAQPGAWRGCVRT